VGILGGVMGGRPPFWAPEAAAQRRPFVVRVKMVGFAFRAAILWRRFASGVTVSGGTPFVAFFLFVGGGFGVLFLG